MNQSWRLLVSAETGWMRSLHSTIAFFHLFLGYRHMPQGISSWVVLSSAEKQGHSSVILTCNWSKGLFKCSKSVQTKFHSYTLGWEWNPTPAVLDPTVPEELLCDAYIWPEPWPASSKTQVKEVVPAPNHSPISPMTGKILPADKPVKWCHLDILAESNNQGESVDTEMKEVVEAFAYDWFSDSCPGCHHYHDSSHWSAFFES
jgi:hypothetical protein